MVEDLDKLESINWLKATLNYIYKSMTKLKKEKSNNFWVYLSGVGGDGMRTYIISSARKSKCIWQVRRM